MRAALREKSVRLFGLYLAGAIALLSRRPLSSMNSMNRKNRVSESRWFCFYSY